MRTTSAFISSRLILLLTLVMVGVMGGLSVLPAQNTTVSSPLVWLRSGEYDASSGFWRARFKEATCKIKLKLRAAVACHYELRGAAKDYTCGKKRSYN